MLKISRASVAICFGVAALAYGDDRPSGEEQAIERLKREIVALEQEWRSTGDPSYFSKATRLVRNTRHSLLMADPRSHTFVLDAAFGVLAKGDDGSAKEFDANAMTAVRHCQNKVVSELASVRPEVMRGFKAWPELRARYARLMMLQRARWISLRDPSQEGPIVLDSTVHPLGHRDAAEDRLRAKRNRQALLQYDVKRYQSETGPKIDHFMVGAFSLEPFDWRMFNEMLLLGRYTEEERTKLLMQTPTDIQNLPEVLRMQLAGPASQNAGHRIKDGNANKAIDNDEE